MVSNKYLEYDNECKGKLMTFSSDRFFLIVLFLAKSNRIFNSVKTIIFYFAPSSPANCP